MKLVILFVFWLPFAAFAQSDLEKAKALFHQEKYEQASVLFEKLDRENPDDVLINEYLGDCAGHQQQWDKALQYYKKLKGLQPKSATYQYKYGGALGMKAKGLNAFKAVGMIDGIRTSFENAIRLQPNHIEARWALLTLYLELPGIIGGSEAKAKRYADQLLVLSPVDGYLAQGKIDEYFKRYTAAEENYKKAIAVGGSKVTYQTLAELYSKKMKLPEKAKAVMARYQNTKE